MRSFRSILLTGGAGFVGSALARHLLLREDLECLVVLDKLTSAGNRGNLIGPDHDPRFHFVEGDIADRELGTRLLHQHQISGVFNLAAVTQADRSLASPYDVVHSNVTGTANLLELCRAAAVPLLQCSTDEVYGSVDPPHRFTNVSRINPTTPHAASKAAADLLCLSAVKSAGQDVVITRCSNNFGPRQHAEEFIPTLVAAALAEQTLPLPGDGMHIRDWIHVDDHCRGLLEAFSQGGKGELYLFGGQCERTNIGIARSVLEVFGKPESLLGYVPDRPGHNRRSAVDFSKATTALGWRPRHKFRTAFPTVARELAANFHAANT